MGGMKRLTFLTLVLCAAVWMGSLPLFALEKQIFLGGEAGWERLRRTQGIRFGSGKGGTQALMLSHAEYGAGEEATDLLLHFNRTPIRDSGTRYTVQSGYSTRIAGFSRLGGGSGSFNELKGGLALQPGESALFSSAPWGDFSIEFWLYPLRLEDGETIMSWQGRRVVEGSVRLQTLACEVTDRRLKWVFDNFFLRPGGAPADVELSARSAMVPEQWHHHLLRFDSRDGVLEYLVDGVPEGIRYITDTGDETGSVLLPYPGQRGEDPLRIGPTFSGFLDEMRISRKYVQKPHLSRFPTSRGIAETEILDLQEARSTIEQIDVDYRAPEESELYCFYRTADSYRQFVSSPPEWNRFVPGARLGGSVRTRWLQLRFELFADGRGELSPRVSSATVRYEPNPPPGPPARLQALPRDGAVVLRWSRVENPDLGGYLLYYGKASGHYRGSGAAEGVSPIDVGAREEIRLTELENGQLYYFAVASYDKAGREHHGALSSETHARPARIYGDDD